MRFFWSEAMLGCDWEEDLQYENGNYFNACVVCGLQFVGHKRRAICKRCFQRRNTVDVECINKLFLELSQFATAKTARQIRLEGMLDDANGVLRSTASISARKGEGVNWDAFHAQVKKILDEQHRFMYPEQYTAASA